jgi:sporulation protein YqfC
VKKDFGLSQEVFGAPLINIVGNNSCELLNHRGIRAFSETEIIVMTKAGDIKISGRFLTIKQIDGDGIRVEGTLLGLAWV